MKMTSITHYKAAWHFASKSGSVVRVSNEGEFPLDGLGAEEFHAVVDLLRNERPLYFDVGDQRLSSLSELVGEGEMK
jgi:hypothetical protein